MIFASVFSYCARIRTQSNKARTRHLFQYKLTTQPTYNTHEKIRPPGVRARKQQSTTGAPKYKTAECRRQELACTCSFDLETKQGTISGTVLELSLPTLHAHSGASVLRVQPNQNVHTARCATRTVRAAGVLATRLK